MAWTLCTSGAAITKAGSLANSTITASGAALANWSNECEATLSSITEEDWVTGYSGRGANFKEILGDTVSDMIAIKIISYDMSGYSSLSESRTLINVIHDNLVRNLAALKDDSVRDKI